MRCLSLRLSVRLSVTIVSCVKTSKHISNFLPSGSQAILFFPRQTGWRYSDGNPLTGGVECRWRRQKTRFHLHLHLFRSQILNRTNIWLCCIQIYSVINRTSRVVWKIKLRRTAASVEHIAASVVRCSHETTTKCLWRARRYTSETKGGQPPRTQPPWS